MIIQLNCDRPALIIAQAAALPIAPAARALLERSAIGSYFAILPRATASAISRTIVVVPIARLRVTFDLHQQLAPVAGTVSEADRKRHLSRRVAVDSHIAVSRID
jgi:hypothetical protein